MSHITATLVVSEHGYAAKCAEELKHPILTSTLFLWVRGFIWTR